MKFLCLLVALLQCFPAIKALLTPGISGRSRGARRVFELHSNDDGNAVTERLIGQATTWCGLNGLMYTDGKGNWTAAPVALVPNTFPRSAFEYASNVQPIINEMVDRIARDRDFLNVHLAGVASSDDFVKRLLEIFNSLPEKVVKDSVHLGLHRSDYMVNCDTEGVETPLQVEINTIASSFGCLSKKVGDLHRYLLVRHSSNPELQRLVKETTSSSSSSFHKDLTTASSMIPENTSIRMLAFGLALAHFLYGDNTAKILFVVQPGERNIADQRLLEQELWASHGIRVEFMTLAQISARGRLGDGNALYIRPDGSKGGDESLVSVAYFRAGYAPTDYPTEIEWAARTMIEKSAATKCPTISYQLAGTKKIQQVLCEQGVLEKFIVSPEDSNYLRECFAAQYSLGSEATPASLAAVENAIINGDNWVLKPQREGGGNNLYGQQLSGFLKLHKGDSLLSGYVLMQRIFPKAQKSAFVRKGELTILPSISELGVYGTFLGDGVSKPLMNECAGYLLRTKPYGVDEGGVAAGFSVLNSILLVDDSPPTAPPPDKNNEKGAGVLSADDSSVPTTSSGEI